MRSADDRARFAAIGNKGACGLGKQLQVLVDPDAGFV